MSVKSGGKQFVDALAAGELEAPGTMKHVELGGKEILIANSNGQMYALCDRCSPNNAPLSKGTLNGKIVTCPMHGAKFDVTTGKKVGEPTSMDLSKLPVPIPESLQKMFAQAAQIMSGVKTYDQPTYETKIEGNKVKVRI